MASKLSEIFGLDHVALSKIFQALYINNKTEIARRESARERIQLYEDRGVEYLEREIDRAFRSTKLRSELKRFAPLALSHNLTKRIVNESSTVYIEGAKRSVDGEDNNRRYQEALLSLKLDQRMRATNRYTQLCNNLLLWPYVRSRGNESKLMLEIVTPDDFWAVPDPLYPLEPVAYIIDQWPADPKAKPTQAHYIVISAEETWKLNKSGDFIPSTLQANPYQRLPILVSRNQSCRKILDVTSGKDIIAGHLSASLQQTYLLRDQKSGTKVPYYTGPSASRVTGQHLDREEMLFFPEGSQVGALDLGASPSEIITAQNAILQQTGAAYGLPLDILNHNYQATSGYEIDLKRLSLREKRREQIVYCRDTERELANYLSALTQAHLPEMAFTTDGWNVDFSEYETPLSPEAEQSLFEKRRASLLTDTVEQMKRLNPDLSEEQCLETLKRRSAVESIRMDLQVTRNQSLSTSIEDAPKSPEQNGALNNSAP